LSVCAITCWNIIGYVDMGLTQLRISAFMGFVLGAVEVVIQRMSQMDHFSASGAHTGEATSTRPLGRKL